MHGIDVSHHQGAVDWQAVRASGVEFAFLKASEGADLRDPEFARSWVGAGRAGIARGAYHFFTFCAPGASQAANFASALGGSAGELPPVADVEFSGNCQQWQSLAAIRKELELFLAQVEGSVGRRPILYVTADARSRLLEGRFLEYPLWPRSVVFEPCAARFPHWLFWQFADNGRVPGISTLVDLDVFWGDRAAFEVLTSTAPPGASQGSR